MKVRAMNGRDRELVAAFLLDRADQYSTKSPCWIALADAAKDVLMGEVEQRAREGEFGPDMMERVRKMARVEGVVRG